MRERNRYTRKRYWRLRRNTLVDTKSSKDAQSYNNRSFRTHVRSEMSVLSHEDDWDIVANYKRREPWADWPYKPCVSNYIRHENRHKHPVMNLTTEEIRRLRGKFAKQWKENEGPDNALEYNSRYGCSQKDIDARQKRKYIDFEKLCGWLIENDHNPKFNALEQVLGHSKYWPGIDYGFWSMRTYQMPAWRFPPSTLIRKWLKGYRARTHKHPRIRRARIVAIAAEHLGYWFYTENQTLSIPVEDRK